MLMDIITGDVQTPRQQLLRKNIARLLAYVTLTLGIFYGVVQVVEWQEESNASALRIEDTMMDYYRETKEQPDTVGMAGYMKHRLSPGDYQLWLREGN